MSLKDFTLAPALTVAGGAGLAACEDDEGTPEAPRTPDAAAPADAAPDGAATDAAAGEAGAAAMSCNDLLNPI